MRERFIWLAAFELEKAELRFRYSCLLSRNWDCSTCRTCHRRRRLGDSATRATGALVGVFQGGAVAPSLLMGTRAPALIVRTPRGGARSASRRQFSRHR